MFLFCYVLTPTLEISQVRKFRMIIVDPHRRRTVVISRTRHVLETERSCVRPMRIVRAKRSRVMMVSVDEHVRSVRAWCSSAKRENTTFIVPLLVALMSSNTNTLLEHQYFTRTPMPIVSLAHGISLECSTKLEHQNSNTKTRTPTQVHGTLREDATTIESVFRTTVRVWDHPIQVRPRRVPWIDPYDVKPMPSVAARLRVTEETHVRKIALNCASQTSTASRTWVCVTAVERARWIRTHHVMRTLIANPTRVFVENVTRARRHV